jgi:hypothetical protein
MAKGKKAKKKERKKKERKAATRWQEMILRESTEEAVGYVTAGSRKAAEAAVDQAFWNTQAFDFATIGSEIMFAVTPIRSKHQVDPVQAMICKACSRPVEWTGLAAEDPKNLTGATIPGPWKHTRSDA